jgi:putative holliday junction resolvase
MPLEAIQRTGRSAALDGLEQVVNHHDARLLVVGLPLLEGGAEGEQAERTRAFMRSVARRLPGLAIAWWDERYSTAEARSILGGSGTRAGQLDSVAAAVILREFLAACPAPATSPPTADT